MDGYKKKQLPWDSYTQIYRGLMEERGSGQDFLSRFAGFQNVCLLCSEASAERCHRSLAAEIIAQRCGLAPASHL